MEERILSPNLEGEEETCLPPRGILFTIDYCTGGKKYISCNKTEFVGKLKGITRENGTERVIKQEAREK